MLYLTLVRSQLAYGSHVWAPQTVNNILSLECIQPRATKFILSLPYDTDVSYKERLKILDFLPITYWHEYLDLVYLFKCVISNSDPNISIKASVRQTRSNTNNGILLNVAKCRTVSYQTSFYIRSAKVWNNLPCCIRDINKSLASFKRALFMYYKDLTETIYDPDDPRSFKTVCEMPCVPSIDKLVKKTMLLDACSTRFSRYVNLYISFFIHFGKVTYSSFALIGHKFPILA